MPELIIIADLPDPKDPDGRSFREVNRATNHSIQIGTLVELDNGVRAFVATHARDCDETPIYSLSPIDPVNEPEDNELIFRRHLFGPYGIESFTVIRNV